MGLLVVELRVGEGLESLSALFFCDEALAFEIVERENILKLGILVDNTPVALHLSVFEVFDKAGFNVVWLLVCKDGSQVLEEFKNLVLPKVHVGFTQHLVVNIWDLQWIGSHFT